MPTKARNNLILNIIWSSIENRNSWMKLKVNVNLCCVTNQKLCSMYCTRRQSSNSNPVFPHWSLSTKLLLFREAINRKKKRITLTVPSAIIVVIQKDMFTTFIILSSIGLAHSAAAGGQHIRKECNRYFILKEINHKMCVHGFSSSTTVELLLV